MTTGGGEVVSDTESGETILQVRIHDEPFKKSGKTVEELNITIARVDIIRSSDGAKITLSEEEQSMDILKISKSDPVVLSTVAVEPGQYEQLRLIIKDNATIKVDGEVFPITIPSGEQSGVKLKGPFTVPSGKLFRLDLDFKPEESVLLNKGQGYKMKPVIEISNTAEIVGIFRGVVGLTEDIGDCETLIELRSDNSARIKVSDYEDYDITCRYNYNSLTKKLTIDNIDVNASDLKDNDKKELMKKIPDKIEIPIKEWTIDSVIVIDIAKKAVKMYRVNSFEFSDSITFTNFTITVKYPNNSMNGKLVATEVTFLESGMPPVFMTGRFNEDTIIHNFKVSDSFIMDSSTTIAITSYIFEGDSVGRSFGFYGGRLSFMFGDTHYIEDSNNSWQPKKTYTLVRDSRKTSKDNKFTVNFEKKLNIRMTPNDFSDNNPVISWDKRDDAKNGYLILVLIIDKIENPNGDDDDGSSLWDIAFMDYTTENSVKILSNSLSFLPIYNSEGVTEPSIKKGDIVRVEVYALDDSKEFSTTRKKGAIYMDSLNIIR